MTTNQGQQRHFATNSLEEAQKTVSARFAPMRVQQLEPRAQFRWRSTLVEVGPIAIAMNEYGAAFEVSSPEGSPDRIATSFPLASVAAETTGAGGTQRIARGRSTHLYSPPGAARFRFDPQYRGLQVTIGTSELSATLGALLGITLRTPLRFAPRLSLERGIGPTLERAAMFVVAESAIADGLFSTPVAGQRFAEAILLKLLHGQSHNYTEHLAKIERASDPLPVRVAAEYLEANLTRPVSIAELAAIAGVSARALQIGFQKHRGVTPVEFLREQRLTLARARLLEGGSSVSIAAVARQCGFAHLGRFSAQYRARFGELPIATRARKR